MPHETQLPLVDEQTGSVIIERPQLFTSKRDDWETPPALFAMLHDEFLFTVDVAANDLNHKLLRWYGPGGMVEDGLQADWTGERRWMNPPFSRKLQSAFIHKAATTPGLTVALLPARTDTRRFHDYIYGKAEIRFLRGRVRFVGGNAGAPFPSMVVVWK